jgi:hypothetical protein
MMRRQRGVTMIGWIFLLIPMAIVLYAGVRLAPIYLNYYKVVEAMKMTASQLKSDDTLSPVAIRTALEKRFDVGYIDQPSVNDVVVRKNESGNWEMEVDYEGLAPLFANAAVLVQFKKAVEID